MENSAKKSTSSSTPSTAGRNRQAERTSVRAESSAAISPSAPIVNTKMCGEALG